MEVTSFVKQIEAQSQALRAAAAQAGPQAPVPTCPGWTVHQLVTHLARVHAWAAVAGGTHPDADRPRLPEAPEHWDDLFPWWDERRAGLVTWLTSADPDATTWAFPGGIPNVAFWVRRQAHETAIHRLDAEHALASSGTVSPELYEPEFAADGIDEAVGLIIRGMREAHAGSTKTGAWLRQPPPVTGRVRFHATDAQRAWEIRFAAGQSPEVAPVPAAATEADATITGTADAVYRAVWGRPSTAVVAGTTSLVDAVRVA